MSLAGERPHAFTARYGGTGQDGADETGLARQLARRYAIDLTVVDIQPDIRHIFEPIVWALDEPHADDSAIPTWLLSQAVGREYKVALTGIGGDELFGGYPRHIGLPLAEVYRKLPAGLRRLASTAADLLPEPRAATLGVDRVKRFLRSGDGRQLSPGLLKRLAAQPKVFRRNLKRSHVAGLGFRHKCSA